MTNVTLFRPPGGLFSEVMGHDQRRALNYGEDHSLYDSSFHSSGGGIADDTASEPSVAGGGGCDPGFDCAGRAAGHGAADSRWDTSRICEFAEILGRVIVQSSSALRFDITWAAISITAVAGIAMYLLVLAVERAVIPWHASQRLGET